MFLVNGVDMISVLYNKEVLKTTLITLVCSTKTSQGDYLFWPRKRVTRCLEEIKYVPVGPCLGNSWHTLDPGTMICHIVILS